MAKLQEMKVKPLVFKSKCLAWHLLKTRCMTNTSYMTKKGGRGSAGSRKPSFSLIDGALVIGFLAAFTGLVFLLAK